MQEGTAYKRSDFGITGAANMQTDHIVGGALYSFFTLNHPEQQNNLQNDGFVFSTKADRAYVLVAAGAQAELHRHVFLRKDQNDEKYVYLGKSIREERIPSTYQDKIYLPLPQNSAVAAFMQECGVLVN
ncbi:hypothetical protein AGMMS49944_22350 [Spirochaetia bacterium]|nr:hypothetical protein AGMMS49944_22350 [Spirochaetia bacterium]